MVLPKPTRYRAKAGPEVVLVAPCAFFHSYCSSHNWLNIIYERATQSKFLPEGPLLLILENIYVNELPNSNLQ